MGRVTNMSYRSICSVTLHLCPFSRYISTYLPHSCVFISVCVCVSICVSTATYVCVCVNFVQFSSIAVQLLLYMDKLIH